MSKIKYYKRVVSGKVKELHFHDKKKDYTIGKSYPECVEDFNEDQLIELCLDEWLDTGLKLGIFKSEDLIPNSSSSS